MIELIIEYVVKQPEGQNLPEHCWIWNQWRSIKYHKRGKEGDLLGTKGDSFPTYFLVLRGHVFQRISIPWVSLFRDTLRNSFLPPIM